MPGPGSFGGGSCAESRHQRKGNLPQLSLPVCTSYQPCETGCKFPEHLVAVSHCLGSTVPGGPSFRKKARTGSGVQPWLVGEPTCVFMSLAPCLSGLRAAVVLGSTRSPPPWALCSFCKIRSHELALWPWS